MPLVLSTHPLHPRAVEVLGATATLQVALSLAADDLIAAAREADILIVRAPIPAALFAHAHRLRAAIRHGAGVDMIPIEAATAAGVLVANVPGANARSVAEYVMGCTIALARRFKLVHQDLRTTGWDQARSHAPSATEIGGKTIGLVGMGNVGREIHALARAFGMRVMAFKPSSHLEIRDDWVFAPLETVIREADFLVLCCPLTDATRGLMNRTRFALMKPAAFLINVARGPIVVEADLVDALEAGRLAGAALDVLAEQPASKEHPLLGRDNVLVTPHLAGITQESMERMGVGAVAEAIRVLNGELPRNLVNSVAVPAYRSRFGI